MSSYENKNNTLTKFGSNIRVSNTPMEQYVTEGELAQKIAETDEYDGIIMADEADNIGVHIGNNQCWEDASYSDKYGFGGYPYGYENLPPKNQFAGIVESDMFSVDGGKGRWNGKDTGNCQNGGHLFEGWNTSHDSRLTMGIGLKDKDVAFVQVFHPTSAEGVNDNYYGMLKLGDDRLGAGTVFSESLMKNQGLICLSTSYTNAVKNTVDKMANAGELSDTDFDATDKIPYGAMYFDKNVQKVKVYTADGWKTLAWEA